MKVHQRLFWLLILLLPTQIGRHFWFDWTQVLGLSIDYLSPTIYLTDILVVAILFFWWLENTSGVRILLKPFHNTPEVKRYWLLGVIFLFLLVNSLLVPNPGAALYKFIKIIEFTLLGFYIAKNNYPLSAIRYPLSLATIYSSLIAIAQFIKQSSLGGLFWWLGERTFSLMTPGIAKAVISGRLVMRPYATFPHPNVLAGFLLVAIILLLGNFKSTNQLINKFKKNWLIGIYWILVFILAIIGLVLSFSRAAWLVGLLVGLWLIARPWWRKKKGVAGLILLTAVIIGLFYLLTSSLSSQEAIDQRVALMKVAIEMIKTNPLTGVGLNNFIPQLPNYWQQFGMTYWLQPVHNIFLLVTAEVGLTGLVIFLWFLILTFKNLLEIGNWKLVISLLAILLTGVADHYWLTLQQSQFLLTIVFGLSWAKERG